MLTVSCPKGVWDKDVKNDVRDKYPILVTKTMLAYVNAMDLSLQLPPSGLKPNHLVSMIVVLTGGIYIDFYYAIENIYKVVEEKIEKIL